jgi:hypothetical protein
MQALAALPAREGIYSLAILAYGVERIAITLLEALIVDAVAFSVSP